jgi:hypothetical protein
MNLHFYTLLKLKMDQEEILERETLGRLMFQLEEGGFFDKGETSSLLGSDLTNEELRKKILHAIDLAQIELSKYERIIRDAASVPRPINPDFESDTMEPILLIPSSRPETNPVFPTSSTPFEVCCTNDDCVPSSHLNGLVIHLPEIVANPADISFTSNLGHHLLSQREPNFDQEERKRLGDRLRQCEQLGFIIEGDTARLLASTMTNKELDDFIINLVD